MLFGDIHFNLDSSTPCWNDPIGGLEPGEAGSVFSKETAKHEVRSMKKNEPFVSFAFFVVNEKQTGCRDLANH
jgi:hypothetical protein